VEPFDVGELKLCTFRFLSAIFEPQFIVSVCQLKRRSYVFPPMRRICKLLTAKELLGSLASKHSSVTCFPINANEIIMTSSDRLSKYELSVFYK
jgi:hypothetical protein